MFSAISFTIRCDHLLTTRNFLSIRYVHALVLSLLPLLFKLYQSAPTLQKIIYKVSGVERAYSYAYNQPHTRSHTHAHTHTHTHTHIYIYIYIYIYILYIRGSLNKFPDFFRMDSFIDSTHMKL